MTIELIYSCVTLTLMELVLGIDNIIFVSILSDKLPLQQQDKARKWGIGLSVVMRILLLFVISLILKMKEPIIELAGFGFSGKDLLLLGGGLFLLYKTVKELIHKLKPSTSISETTIQKAVSSYSMVVTQIMIINLVFSIDTILTAVGLVESVFVMAFAVIASSILMLVFAKPIINIINKFPGIKIIAFLFLIFIGMYLILEAFHIELSKGYLYVSMVVCLISEWLNIVYRRNTKNL
jgi:predicted tellurium resistance membrane protein TerC